MLAPVVPHLRCPRCSLPFGLVGMVLRCQAGHAFDVARQGYVNLLPPQARTGTADTAAMVDARARVLAAGHLDGVTRLLADAAGPGSDGIGGCVLDLGAGTGHHLAGVLDALPGRPGLALDLSVPAARRAARAHPRLGAVVVDVWEPLPVPDATAALVLDVFAPRVGAEIARVLAPGGSLLVVTPTPDHLAELVGPLGLLTVDGRKNERLQAALGEHLEPAGTATYDGELVLPREEAGLLAAMGPSAHHLGAAELQARVASLPARVAVTVSVRLSRWRRPGAVSF